jgi:uncharacterized damage-inducible protein DinB/predicted RNase H-like HicB family nuclease
MTRYAVYLEIADDSRCMAHALDLPGCVVRAPTRSETLSQVPEAVRETHAWLRRHGEPALSADDPIEVEVAGEISGIGPFDRRSAAALFLPDREPVAPEEMARYFRLMGHARTDLLALVRDLTDDVLNWQPDPESFTIRGLLRHVGNAEKWYVSRIMSPETLPPEWKSDENQPIFEFLEMERRTAVARLRQITEEERSGVFCPAGWPDHPKEPWTARKVLRRFLEHEREHTGQVREILAVWRDHLLARLAAERAGLLWQFIGLDERELTESPVFGDWTAKDLLAHVASWDELSAERIALILAGRGGEITGVDPNIRNAALHAERRDWPLERALGAFLTARADFLATLARLPDEELHQMRRFPWGEASVYLWTQWCIQHDADHAADLVTWREARGLERRAGPKTILQAALAAAREELLAAAALIPAEARTSRPVCGEWTLKDMLGHIADWEWLGVEGLSDMATGRLAQVEHVEDVGAWNQAHAEARRDQPWEEVWTDFHAAHKALLEILKGMSETDLARRFPFPWGPEGTPYQWVCIYVAHDRGHAGDLRDTEGS